MKTIEEAVSHIEGTAIYSVFDASSGYWQVALNEKSSKLCTFNARQGRYRFTRHPFGIKCASKIFQRIMEFIFEGLEGVEVIVDDILVWALTILEHNARVRAMCRWAEKYVLTFYRPKTIVGVPRVTWVGHTLSEKGLQPSTSAPLWQLLEKGVEWHWEAGQQNSFDKLKWVVAKAPVLRIYDPKAPVVLNVDASSKGLGAVILQDGQPVAFGSRALTSAQEKYAQIEKEMLAILYGCTKFNEFLSAREVTVETDYKPVVGIFEKNLYQLSPRIQRIEMRLEKYDLKLKWVPGHKMHISDTLS